MSYPWMKMLTFAGHKVKYNNLTNLFMPPDRMIGRGAYCFSASLLVLTTYFGNGQAQDQWRTSRFLWHLHKETNRIISHCLTVCLTVCLSICLSDCLSACLGCLPNSIPSYINMERDTAICDDTHLDIHTDLYFYFPREKSSWKTLKSMWKNREISMRMRSGNTRYEN